MSRNRYAEAHTRDRLDRIGDILNVSAMPGGAKGKNYADNTHMDFERNRRDRGSDARQRRLLQTVANELTIGEKECLR
jgi:hypothetical protein